MKKILIGAIISFCLLLSMLPAHAQQGVPIGPGDGDGHTTPIGGIAVIAALGGGYALKKLHDRKK